MGNKYPGKCNACGCDVAAGLGVLKRNVGGYHRRTKWIVWCQSCYNKSDNSGFEDRCPALLSPEQQEIIDHINQISQFDMCCIWRYAPPGHPYLDCTLPYAEVFKARLFGHFGGFTPEISKAL